MTSTPSSAAPAAAAATPVASPTPSVRDAALAVLRRMTLEQKVGQVFVLGFEGTEVNAANRALVRDLHLGGVTLFARNVENPVQVARLVRGLQAIADPVPLFVTIDQEGGLVVRVAGGATLFPGAMALGAAGDTELAHRVAAAAARELRAMGVNMNLAPVVDVNTNPRNPVIGVRAFGSDPALVARLGAATVEGHQANGVSAVAKHFPGHGDTAVDSHLDLPVVPHALDRLLSTELPPFQAAIRAGVDGVMTAHVYLPAIEPRRDVPATLSAAVLDGLLRQRLGFQGLILTDALDMQSIKRDRSAADAAVDAFEAGADLLLIAGILREDRARLAEGPPALLAAVRSGRISEARLDASVLRVLEAKARRGVLATTPAPAEDEVARVVGSPEHRALALDAARRALTVVRDQAGLLPLNPARPPLVVQPEYPTRSLVEEEGAPASLAAAIRRFSPAAEEARLDPASDAAVARVVARARSASVVVLGSYDLAQHRDQQTLARALRGAGPPLVVVALRGPYDADALPEAPTVLAVYGDRPIHVLVAAEGLFGQTPPAGRAP